jgi:hypothetical protein
MLGELTLAHAENGAVLVYHEGAGGSGALVEGENGCQGS